MPHRLRNPESIEHFQLVESEAGAACATFGRPKAYPQTMADQDLHVPAREVLDVEPTVDPLIAFYSARLDEAPGSPDVAAKKAVLDDYARHCADVDNPARELICQATRDVIKHLATVYDQHPDYREDFRP
jgi:hypothetical protein